MPTTVMQPLIDPVLMRNAASAEVADEIATILQQTAAAPETVLCAWSFDRETPLANVAAMYEVVAECNHE